MSRIILPDTPLLSTAFLRHFVSHLSMAVVGLFCAEIAFASDSRDVALSPTEALKAFQVDPGLRIEVVAAEPLVIDPVAFAFDEHKRLYVVEDRGYPDPADGTITHEGRIALLEDTNGDGVYDTRTEFVTGLTFPNGIVCWKGGVFVTCAPNIYYFKDTDGDGIADVRKTVLTGFGLGNSNQNYTSHPTLGLDGKIYITCGRVSGGNVSSPEHPERPAVKFPASDGRFDPESFVFETTGGRGQFGLAFDPFGRRFLCTSIEPVLQVVLEPWQLRRNRFLPFADTMEHVSKTGAEAPLYPISSARITSDFDPHSVGKTHRGTFTSASGLVVFDGSALPSAYDGNIFVCEPAQNLVQRQVLEANGATFRSAAAATGREFLGSTDTWFRPVFLANGPDGALYLADMYRREIDHPKFYPKEAQASFDAQSGKDRGRIYRIVRTESKSSRPTTPPDNVIASLESPDGWSRETARRLLLERGETGAESTRALEQIAKHGKSAAARTAALWVLRDLEQLTSEVVLAAIQDPDPRVREQAVTLAVELPQKESRVASSLIATANDQDARVRFTTALALGSVGDAHAVDALAAIAVRDGEDRWTRAAALSGIEARIMPFFDAVMGQRDRNPSGFALVTKDLARIVAAGASIEDCARFLKRMLGDESGLAWQVSALAGFAESLRGRRDLKLDHAGDPLAALIARENGSRLKANLEKFYQRIIDLARDENAPVDERLNAIMLIGYVRLPNASEMLEPLLAPRQAAEVQLQAVLSMADLADAASAQRLLRPDNWSHYTPRVKEAIVSTLAGKPALVDQLFTAITAGVVKTAEISPLWRQRLLKLVAQRTDDAAAVISRVLQGGDRMAVYRANHDILALRPDAVHGKEVFTRVCSTCHTYAGSGGNVGPDLTGIRNQTADTILLHMLVPNYEIAPGYETVSIKTRDGRSISGWIMGETGNGVSLRTAVGGQETVLRKDIEVLESSAVSLMPEGLE